MARVRVRLLTQLVGIDYDLPAGSVVELDEEEAARFCRRSPPLAVYEQPATETATRESVERAVRRRRRGR